MLDSGFAIPIQVNLNNVDHNLRDSTRKCIWLSQEELVPNNLEAIKEVLRNEKTPLKYWLLLAFSYKSLGHSESSDSLLKDSETLFSTEECSSYLKGSLYSSLAYHNLTQAFQFKNDEDRHTRYMDWTNHYARKSEGHLNLLNYSREKNMEYLSAARSIFQVSMNLNHTSIITVILYGNVMVLGSNYQLASVQYLRALIMTSYYLSIVENFSSTFEDNEELLFEIGVVRSQLSWLKALLLYALSSCQFSMGNVDSAKVLIDESISVKRLSISYRLYSAINAYQLTHFKDDIQDVDIPLLFEQYGKSSLLSYVLDKNNPLSQLHLCEFLFHRGDLEECSKKLLDLKKLNLPYNLRSELEYQLGRLEHFKGNYSGALNSYLNAISLRSDFMIARLQLVKVAAGSGDLSLAREHCDFLLQCMHKVSVVLKVSAYVYLCSARETLETNRWDMLKLESNNKSQNQLDISCMFHTVQQGMGRLIDERLFKSVSLLDDILFSTQSYEAEDDEVESPKLDANLGLKLSERPKGDFSDPMALEYYIRSLEILISRGREYLCPNLKEYYCEYFKLYKSECPQFINNYGVILMYTRDYTKACKVLQDLMEQLSIEESSDKSELHENGSDSEPKGRLFLRKTLKLTVKFNYALALEFSGQISRAQKIYSSITREFPRYTPAWLRRSIIAFKKCDYENNLRYLDQVKKIHPLSCEPYLIRAHQLGSTKSFDEAIHEIRKMFKLIPVSVYDPYANTLLASLIIKKSYRIAQTTGVSPPFPKEAMQYAKTALKRPSVCNLYAANCIAVLLAMNKNLKASYESFLLLLESLSMTSHMKLLVNKNMGIVSAAITLAFMGTDKKFDRNKLNKLKVAKTQQYFQSAISNGKMDKNLYTCYIRFLFDVQKYEECLSMLETARLVFQDEMFTYNQIIVTDAMICSNLRDAEKTNSVVEMSNMLSGCKFVTSTGDYFVTLNQKGHPFLNSDSYNRLKQILARIKTKVIPHITSTLPQLEKSCENKQKAREKRLQLQLSIQQAQESKKRQMEEERIKAAEAEEALSQQLLKEASEIASELLTSKTPQT